MNIYQNIPFVLGAKLHKIAKQFNCGTKIWDKIVNSKQQCILSALNTKLYKNKIVFETWDQICPNLEFRVKFELQITYTKLICSTSSERQNSIFNFGTKFARIYNFG